MAHHLERVVPVPAEVAAGAAVNVEHWADVVVQITIETTATVQVQVSYDGGTTYFNEGTALTATGVVAVAKPAATHVRANTTSYDSGAVSGRVRGYDIRTT